MRLHRRVSQSRPHDKAMNHDAVRCHPWLELIVMMGAQEQTICLLVRCHWNVYLERM